MDKGSLRTKLLWNPTTLVVGAVKKDYNEIFNFEFNEFAKINRLQINMQHVKTNEMRLIRLPSEVYRKICKLTNEPSILDDNFRIKEELKDKAHYPRFKPIYPLFVYERRAPIVAREIYAEDCAIYGYCQIEQVSDELIEVTFLSAGVIESNDGDKMIDYGYRTYLYAGSFDFIA